MNTPSFLSSVWRWKYSGVFIWSSVVYTAFLFVVYLLSFLFSNEISCFSVFLSFAVLPLDIFLYMKTLTVVPVSHSVLSAKKLFFRILWFFLHWSWLFFLCFAFVGVRRSALFSFAAAIFLTNTLSFSVFVPEYALKSAARMNRIDVVMGTYVFPAIPVMFLVGISVFFGSLHFIIIGVCIYLMSDTICRICEIIAGEPISFGSIDTSRLSEGLDSQGLVQFWAYTDLLLSSTDPSNQRRELIFHSDGECFRKIVCSLASLFKKYSNAQFNIFDDIDPTHYSLTRINDGSLKKEQRRKIVDDAQQRQSDISELEKNLDQKQKIAKKVAERSLWNKFLKFTRLDQLKTIRYIYQTSSRRKYTQALAVEDSIQVIEAIRAIYALIYYAPKEDKYGILQSRVELFIDGLLTISRATKNSAHNLWIDYTYQGPVKRYNSIPFAKTPEDLTSKVYQIANETINMFVSQYGDKMDKSKISESNVDELELYKL